MTNYHNGPQLTTTGHNETTTDYNGPQRGHHARTTTDTPTLPFLQNFKWAYVWMYALNILAKFETRRPVPEIILTLLSDYHVSDMEKSL